MRQGNVLQLVIMSAIVATVLIVPFGALVTLGCLVCGVSPYSVLTFGGHIDELRAVGAWWGIALVPAAAYAVYVTHLKEH